MRKIGYARVSTSTQNLDRQIGALDPTRRWSRQLASCVVLQHGGEEIQFAPHGVRVGIPNRQAFFRHRVQ